jgi:hypothetical protein
VTDTILAAGHAIHHEVDNAAGGKPILVIGRADTLDLATGVWIEKRLRQLDDEARIALDAHHCKKPTDQQVRPAPGGGARAPLVQAIQPSPADITAALATDVTISPITLNEDDRMLISAVAQPRPTWAKLPSDAAASTSSPQASSTPGRSAFYVPGELADVGPGNRLFDAYNNLLDDAGNIAKDGCDSDFAKGATSDISDFAKSVGASSGKGQAPLMVAAELVAAHSDGALVLRVAIEQAGGTAITRSNIWYTLIPFLEPVKLSAGLLASYRLTDPTKGQVVASGLVRCMTDQVGFKDVQSTVLKGSDLSSSCAIAAR